MLDPRAGFRVLGPKTGCSPVLLAGADQGASNLQPLRQSRGKQRAQPEAPINYPLK